MDVSTAISAYILIGLVFVLVAMLFPYQYINGISYVLLVIKTASLKQKSHLSKNKNQVKFEQQNYLKDLDDKIDEQSRQTQESQAKFNIALFKLIISWPLVLFLIMLAGFFKLWYLDDPDFP